MPFVQPPAEVEVPTIENAPRVVSEVTWPAWGALTGVNVAPLSVGDAKVFAASAVVLKNGDALLLCRRFTVLTDVIAKALVDMATSATVATATPLTKRRTFIIRSLLFNN